MNILIIGWNNNTNISGGMDIHIHNIAKNLASKGHHISVFIHESQTNQTIKETINENITYISIPTAPNKSKNNTDFLKLIENYNNQIINHIKNINFDIILSHDWIGINAASKLKTKTNLWIHTVHSLEYMRSLENTNIKKSEIENLEKKGILNADIVFTVSKYMQKEILKKYHQNTKLIYNGSSFTTFTTNKTIRTPTKTPTILYIGRLTAQKGVEYLILASKKIIKKYPETKFIIAGKGELKQSLQNFAHTLCVSNNFKFLGFIPNEKLIELYTSASIFVSPSIYEPFGITILDAAYFKCPIIATKNTGAIELFPSNLISIIEPQNSKSLSEKIINVLENPKIHETKAKELKNKIEKTNFWNITTDKIINEIKNKQ
ncbi:glycosyltransferase [archaeon]|nr:glycosyltransferase [archaeon]